MLRLANRQLTATSQTAHLTGRPERQDQPEHRTALRVTRYADVPAQEPGVLQPDSQARPLPAPARAESALQKRSKTCGRYSGGMPGPRRVGNDRHIRPTPAAVSR